MPASALPPRQAGAFPASQGASAAGSVDIALKAFEDVEALEEAVLLRSGSGMVGTMSAAAEEKQQGFPVQLLLQLDKKKGGGQPG